MTQRHAKIKELGLDRAIKRMYYVDKLSHSKIAQETGLPQAAIERFLREDKLKNFNDIKLESIAKSDDYNALSLIESFFQAAAFSTKELAMTAIVAQILREEIADIITEQGVVGLASTENEKLVNLWFKNTEKLTKLVANHPKMLDTYINLYSTVLDIQKQVSYVRAMTDAIEKAAPEIRNQIMKELDKDHAAKAVLNSLSTDDIVDYWGNKSKVLESGS